MSYIDRVFSLSGKTALVTGAGGAIGNAIASGLLHAEATVILVDCDFELLLRQTQSLRKEGLEAHCISCDLSQPNEIASLVDEVRDQFTHLDVLINNAGVTSPHEVLDYPLSSWEETMQVNLCAPFLLAQQVARMMQASGGSIINITSINAEVGFPNNPAYAAAKGGLKQLTKALAVDLGPFGIRVNNIGPGYTFTAMTAKSYNDSQTREQRRPAHDLEAVGRPAGHRGLGHLSRVRRFLVHHRPGHLRRRWLAGKGIVRSEAKRT